MSDTTRFAFNFMIMIVPNLLGLTSGAGAGFDERMEMHRAKAGRNAFFVMVLVSGILLLLSTIHSGEYLTADFALFWSVVSGVTWYSAETILRGSFFGMENQRRIYTIGAFILFVIGMVLTVAQILALTDVMSVGEKLMLRFPFNFLNTYGIGLSVMYGTVLFSLVRSKRVEQSETDEQREASMEEETDG